jgi:hypothetical protein
MDPVFDGKPKHVSSDKLNIAAIKMRLCIFLVVLFAIIILIAARLP